MRVVAIISWIMYALAWCFPALRLISGGQPQNFFGFECVWRGFLGLLVGNFEVLANPIFIIASALLFTNNKIIGAVLAIIALLLASQTFTLFGTKIMLDEGGVATAQLKSFGPGFYLWYGAISLVAAVAVVRLFLPVQKV